MKAVRLTSAIVGIGLIVPGKGQAQVSRVDPRTIGTRVLASAQVLRIPDVRGKPISDAENALAWTKLEIVQRDSIMRGAADGFVIAQRPQAGTPLRGIRSETLYISRQPRVSVASRAGAVVGSVLKKAAPNVSTFVPPSPSRDDVPKTSGGVAVDPTPVTVTVPPQQPPKSPLGTSTNTVPGVAVVSYTFVPDLYNRPSSVVGGLLKDALLVPHLGGRENNDVVPAGNVFRQHPEAKAKVIAGSVVDVWISEGPHPQPPTITVPSVIGLTLDLARDSLRRVGLGIGHVDRWTQEGASGRVIHQTPHEGTTGHPGEIVDLAIAVSPPQVHVPRVIGLSLGDARNALTAAKLAQGSLTLVAVAGRDTLVLKQQPVADALVDPGSFVDLVVNRLPVVRRVAVPSLIGLTREAADTALQRAELFPGDVVVTGDTGTGKVVRQVPGAGDTVFVRSRVSMAIERDRVVRPGTPMVKTDTTTDTTTLVFPVPSVVNRSVEEARLILGTSGFSNLSFAGDSVTAGAIVTAQDPVAGSMGALTAPVAMTVVFVPPPPPMPNLVGKRVNDARVEAAFERLSMSIVRQRRAFVLREFVFQQEPPAASARRLDNTVDVQIQIPFIPPILALFLGVGGAGAGITVAVRRLIKPDPTRSPQPEPPKPKPPATNVSFNVKTQAPEPPKLSRANDERLVKSVLTFRFNSDSGKWVLHTAYNSLISSKGSHDA